MNETERAASIRAAIDSGERVRVTIRWPHLHQGASGVVTSKFPPFDGRFVVLLDSGDEAGVYVDSMDIHAGVDPPTALSDLQVELDLMTRDRDRCVEELKELRNIVVEAAEMLGARNTAVSVLLRGSITTGSEGLNELRVRARALHTAGGY